MARRVQSIPPMPAARLGLLVAAALLPACLPTYPPLTPQGTGDAAPGGDAAGGTGPVAFFGSTIQPIMQSSCVVCHGTLEPVFLVAPDWRASMLAFPGLVVPGSPDTSTLLTIGTAATHTGIELTVDQAALVRQWIEME